jgi:hypothetical protein
MEKTALLFQQATWTSRRRFRSGYNVSSAWKYHLISCDVHKNKMQAEATAGIN